MHAALQSAFEQVTSIVEYLKQRFPLSRFERIFREHPVIGVDDDCPVRLEQALTNLLQTIRATAQSAYISPASQQTEAVVAPSHLIPGSKTLSDHNIDVKGSKVYSKSYKKTRISGQARVLQGDYHQNIYIDSKRCVVPAASCMQQVQHVG